MRARRGVEEAELLGRRVLTRAGAARALCMSVDKLDRMTNARELACIRHPTLGRVYRPEDLERWLDSVTSRAARAANGRP